MALANGYWEHEGNARTGLTFREQWDEPFAGLELAREGLEIARRSGSAVYGFQMVGNGVACAIRVGEWDWAARLLEDWIPSDATSLEQLRQYAEFFVDRAVLTALRGGDPSADIEQAAAIRVGITDPQYESYEVWARAWAAFSAGQFPEAREHALAATKSAVYFVGLSVPLAARASLWARDPKGAREAIAEVDRMLVRGAAIGLDKASIEAGIAALEGRTAQALSLYREALRGWRNLRLAWDEALTVVDMVTFLGPDEAEVRAAADWARETLMRLGATPYLERLETALAGNGKAPPIGQHASDLARAEVARTV